MKLSVIVPVFNEQDTIQELITRVVNSKIPKGVKKEIIIINDGSTDDTEAKIQSLKKLFKNVGLKSVKHRRNYGKGYAIRSGIKVSSGDVVVIQDADLEYDPNDYSKLIQPILAKKANVVYGSRLKNYPLRLSGRKKTPLITHYLGNKFLTLITNLLYGNKLSDMETCYKMATKDVLKKIKLNSDRFEIEAEITAKILKNGYKIYEIPIKVNPRGYVEGKKITWKDGFIAVWTLVKYRFID